MINFLHTFEPQAIFLSFGPFNIYYYGLFIVIGIIFGLFTALKLGDKYGIKKSFIIDFSFYLIIAAIISARIFHILLELPFYLENPSQMIKIWEGGLAIHGAIIAGVITSYVLTKKEDVKFWVLVSILTPGLAFAQALGRWGNYFNQELFGKPTSLPWGIPISPENRVSPYFYSEYYHPTFIYESIGSFLFFWFWFLFIIIL